MGQFIPGTLVHNLEIHAGKGGQFIRSAGGFGKILRPIERGLVRVRLPSKLILSLPFFHTASVGRIGNRRWRGRVIGKAGVSRGLGRRPIVRGVAMNAVDHPHGGNSGPGRSSRTPWG